MSSPKGVAAASALATALLVPAIGVAAPKRLDCNLTTHETRMGPNLAFERENRPIAVVFDDETKSLAVYQDGEKRGLSHVTITRIFMNGYVDEMSLGIDMGSWSIVLQAYKPEATIAEFGVCSQSAELPPS
jgi:hypothetical protein